MKLFLKILLMVGLINPGITLAKHKQSKPSKSDISVELIDFDDLAEQGELPQKKNKGSVLGKVVFAVGALAALAVAGYYVHGLHFDSGAAGPGTRINDVINLVAGS